MLRNKNSRRKRRKNIVCASNSHEQSIESKPVTLAEVKVALDIIVKRDTELAYRSNKVKDFLDSFIPPLSVAKKDQLIKKLQELNIPRLKDEHLVKIIDFLPTTADELRVILQAYPLSLAKKDQESIITVVSEFTK